MGGSAELERGGFGLPSQGMMSAKEGGNEEGRKEVGRKGKEGAERKRDGEGW